MDKDAFLSQWGSRKALAEAIGEGETTVRAWFTRGSIPARYDAAIIEASQRIGMAFGPVEMHELRLDLLRRTAGAEAAA